MDRVLEPTLMHTFVTLKISQKNKHHTSVFEQKAWLLIANGKTALSASAKFGELVLFL